MAKMSSIEKNKKRMKLVKKFKTKNGREVTDSRGVEPDIKVEP